MPDSSPAAAEKLKRLVPLAKAAKLAGRRYYFLRELVETGRLKAWKQGERSLLVDPEDVPAAVLAASEYVPAAVAARRPRAKVAAVTVDPNLGY